MSDYDQEIEKIEAKNKLLIGMFLSYLEESRLSSKTIKNHRDNLDFFAEYLMYYEPCESLYEMSPSDVSIFLGDFFPRKAMWASPTNVKLYIATFRKFFKWMIASGHRPKEDYGHLLELIQDEKEDWLSAVSYEDDYYY